MNKPIETALRWLKGADSDACYTPDIYGAYPTGTYPSGTTNYYSGMGTPRDQSSQTFSNWPRVFTRWELENAFRSSWIAKRIVSLPPKDMVREWREFHIENDEGEQTDALLQAEKALQLKKRCEQALKWARLYGGALMFLGIEGDDPALPLVPDLIRKGSLTYVLVLDRWHVTYDWTGNSVYDIAMPSFGLPEFYTIANTGQRWHNSRVVRFDGEELPMNLWLLNMRWGDSVLNHCLATVLGLEAAQKAALLAMQQGSLDIVSLPNMKQQLSKKNGMQEVKDRIRIFSDLKSVYRTAVKDVDEKFDRIAASLGGYDALFEKYQDEVCGAAEMPHTVLYGQSPKGLSATGEYDTRQYYDSISAKQESDLRPQLDYIDQVFVRSVLGAMPDDYSFDFISLWQIDEAAQAQIDFANAQRDHIYMTDGALLPEMVTKQLLDDETYSTLTEEDVEMIESYNEPMDEPTTTLDPASAATLVAAPGSQFTAPTNGNGKGGGSGNASIVAKKAGSLSIAP
jgi:uncharacterized protein